MMELDLLVRLGSVVGCVVVGGVSWERRCHRYRYLFALMSPHFSVSAEWE